MLPISFVLYPVYIDIILIKNKIIAEVNCIYSQSNSDWHRVSLVQKLQSRCVMQLLQARLADS